MGEKIKHTGNELKKRWLAKMPKFFKRIIILCAIVVTTAIGVNTMLGIAGATPHEWWTNIYPLLIGVPTGMAIVCKLTVEDGYKDIDTDKLTRYGDTLKRDEKKKENT